MNIYMSRDMKKINRLDMACVSKQRSKALKKAKEINKSRSPKSKL